MSKSAKYTSNFVDRSKPGMYSDAVAPEFTAEDAGKTFAVGEDGNISLSDQPIVFHAVPDDPESPLEGGTITESAEKIEAACGKPAMLEISFGAKKYSFPVWWERNIDGVFLYVLTTYYYNGNIVLMLIKGSRSSNTDNYTIQIEIFPLGTL